jgi:hypothetical protein
MVDHNSLKLPIRIPHYVIYKDSKKLHSVTFSPTRAIRLRMQGYTVKVSLMACTIYSRRLGRWVRFGNCDPDKGYSVL